MHLDLSLKSDLDMAGPSELGVQGSGYNYPLARIKVKPCPSKGRELLLALPDFKTFLRPCYSTTILLRIQLNDSKRSFYLNTMGWFFLRGHSYFVIQSFHKFFRILGCRLKAASSGNLPCLCVNFASTFTAYWM